MNNMESDGPYKMKDDLQLRDKNGNLIDDFVVLGNVQEILIANLAFAEGRKSMEKEIEEKKAIKDALLCGTGFVMEGKRVPPEDVYLSETEIKLQKVEKDFRELLELKNKLSGATGGYTFQGA